MTTWSGAFTYSATEILTPATRDELRAAVARYPKVRGLGSRHSFSRVADSPHTLIDTQRLNGIIAMDADTVTIEPGVTYGQLAPYLHEQGRALANLASLPDIAIAGAVATGTHGSGDRVRNLANQVTALRLIGPDGSETAFREGDPDFPGVVVSMGALGVVSELTLRTEPAFDVRQSVFTDLPWDAVYDHFDEITGAAYSVSLFTHWRTDRIDQVWLKRREHDSAPGDHFFGAQRSPARLHPIRSMSADNCTEQLDIPGPWYDRLPHFSHGRTPSAGAERQSEYLVARGHALAALRALRPLRNRIGETLLVSEIRTMAADDLWLSGAYGRDTVGIHFTWAPDDAAILALLPDIEAALAPFKVRPHWGKIALMDTSDGRYPQMEAFRRLAMRLDPDGKFRNPFVNRNVFGTKA